MKSFKIPELSRVQKMLVIAGVIAVSFLISLISVLVIEGGKQQLVLSFPHAREEGRLVTRPRYAVKRSGREAKVYELVQQLGLGPNEELRDSCYSIFPLGMKARAVIESEGELFLELPVDFILYESESAYTVERSVEILEYNLKQNFNWISKLKVAAAGEILLEWSLMPESQIDSEVDNDETEPGEESR